ncbi:MAG: AraC family transcriptional regulator [Pseudomonadota bacterium]
MWHAFASSRHPETSHRIIEPGLHIGCGIATLISRGQNGDLLRLQGTTFIVGCFDEPEEYETNVDAGEVRCVGVRLSLDDLSGESLAVAEKVVEGRNRVSQHVSPMVLDLAGRLTAPLPLGVDEVASELFLEARGLELLAAAHSIYFSRQEKLVSKRHQKVAHDARAYIDEHLHRDVTILGLAREIGSSERVLTTAFRSVFDETIAAYVTRKRMERASQLLRLGQHVSEAALAINYSPNAFSTAFKQYFGVSPREVRSATQR